MPYPIFITMALYLKKELDNDAQIFVWEVTESEKQLMELSAPIPNDELEDLSFIKSEARRREKQMCIRDRVCAILISVAIFWR